MARKLSQEVGQANPVQGLHGDHNTNRIAEEDAGILGDVLLHRMGQENLHDRRSCEHLFLFISVHSHYSEFFTDAYIFPHNVGEVS